MAIPFITELSGLLSGNIIRLITFEILLLLVSAFFIWTGAKVAQIRKGSFGRSFLTALAIAFLLPMALLPFSGLVLISLIASLVITLAIIKVVFDASWRSSLVTLVFSAIAQAVSLALLIFVLAWLL
ncbi:MAG: hypothetical protein DRO99_03585 [Candidatus Aenigmatarchaeota archaeon]|nr:MAG: hypothetical protein DRO99_03585 [Candidatus Aenigmarchaeota archaeon]